MTQQSTETPQPQETPIDKDVEAHCLKCQCKKIMVAPMAVTMKNGRAAAKGKCPDCGTTVFRTGKQ